MSTRRLDGAASLPMLLTLACMGAPAACSAGAPETVSESGGRVPEFGTGLPGRGSGAVNGGSVNAAEGSAPMGNGSDGPANGDAVGAAPGSSTGAANTGAEGTSVSGLDPGSAVDSNGGSNTGTDPASGGTDPASGGTDPAGGGTDPAGGGTDPAGGGTDPAGGGVSSSSCALDVTVTTSATSGRYAPRNVGAIWIADASGQFIKSLEVWGNRRLEHVTAWNDATASAGAAENKVDAITSATLTAHRTHDVSWNCLDFESQPVPDGSYRVYFEVTEANGSGPNHFESFDKGPSPSTLEATAQNFNGIVLSFTP